MAASRSPPCSSIINSSHIAVIRVATHGLKYAASSSGAKSIALVGFDGGLLHRECTCSILVPVESTPQAEAIHLVIEHLLMQLIRDDFAAHGS